MASRNPVDSRQPQDPLAAGRAAMEESRFEEAANHFKSALRAGPRSAEEEALIRCQLSEALEKRALYQEQLEAVAKYEQFSDFVRLSDHTQMAALIRLGWGYSFNNNIPRAIALFNQAMQIARRLEDHDGIGACYFGLGRAYRNISEIRIARDHYTSALEHYRQVGNYRRLAESYINIGYVNANEGDYRTALHSLNQALTILGDKDEHGLLGRAYMGLAITYDHLGSTSKALISWDRCITHFKKAGNATYLAVNQNNLADKLIWLGEWDRAEELVKSAIEVLREASPANYAGTIDTLAQIYLLRGRVDEADRLLEESLKILSAIKTGEWVEINTRLTIGRSYLIKGRPDQAISHLERAIEISVRAGDNRLICDVRLWLAEALLEMGRVEEAREIVEGVRSFLRETPTLLAWGLMMRMAAKIEAADGHLAAAIQSLGQSTSTYEFRGNLYACAVNRVVLAGMLEKQGDIEGAISEVESALAVFERFGAAIDERKSRAYLESLRSRQGACASPTPAGGPKPSSLDLVSAIDGFITQRIVQASVIRELLLYELASVVREQASSRAAAVAELIQGEEAPKTNSATVKIVASVGLGEERFGEEVELLTRLGAGEYARNFVYGFTDRHDSKFLLHIIGPRAERFRIGNVSLDPLLSLVEQGLETQLLRSRTRRTQVFNPSRLLAQVEIPGFICASRAMTRVLEQVHKIRSSDVTVLITGESGTGKELIARAVHAGSSRRFNVFSPFNCSAAPREMIESQLFGYRKGAFTGAIANNLGIIRTAEGGTLFLDEMGDLPLELQPKLLRFLQEGEIHPIGENQPVQTDVRVIAATNSELERAVKEGRFREDLFHRLNVIRIQVPPLRERREEIPALVDHYLKLYQQESAKRDIQLSEEAVDLMVVYDWPGNVRQLCNEVRRIVAYSDSGTIVTPDALSPEIIRASHEIKPVSMSQDKLVKPSIRPASGSTLAEAVEELERQMIQDALHRSSGNVARAAKELGLSRKGLYLKMDRLKFKM